MRDNLEEEIKFQKIAYARLINQVEARLNLEMIMMEEIQLEVLLAPLLFSFQKPKDLVRKLFQPKF